MYIVLPVSKGSVKTKSFVVFPKKYLHDVSVYTHHIAHNAPPVLTPSILLVP